jgi:PAS domain S-box-containing protein
MSSDSDTIDVLHVDDDSHFLDLTVTVLEQQSEEISLTSTTSPSDGLAKLADNSVDCIVSDYEMPKQDGIEFLEAVREENPELPFILFTGKGSEEIAAEAISMGATDYIQKTGETSQYTVLVNRIRNAVEQYRTKQQMEQANRRRRRTLQRITDGFAELDSDLMLTDVNEQALKLTEHSREELIGMYYDNLIPNPGSSDFIDMYREVLETGEPQTVVAPSDVAPDRWLEERIFPAEDGDGVFTYFRDITERKRGEQELEEQRQLYSTLVDQSPNGVMIVQDKEIMFVNQAMTTMTGWSETDLLGRPFYEVLVREYRELAKQRYEERIRGQQPPQNYNLEIRTRGGEQRIIDLHVSQIQYDGRPATLATFNDVTEFKEREQTLSALHDAATEISRAERPAQVYETLINTAERVLDYDFVVADVEHDGLLIQEAWNLDLADGDYYDETSLEDDDTFAVRAYNRQETILVDDLREYEITPADSDYRAVLTVPIGVHGTFQTVSTKVGAFDEHDREFTELLVNHARVKLDQHDDQGREE